MKTTILSTVALLSQSVGAYGAGRIVGVVIIVALVGAVLWSYLKKK